MLLAAPSLNYRNLLILLLFCLFSGSITYAQETAPRCQISETTEPFKIIYFKPDSVDNDFWKINKHFALAVANDLEIDLEVVNITREMSNRIMFAELLEKHIDASKPPDFIISVLYAGGEAALIRQLNDFNIPFFTVNTSIDDRVLAQAGKPREKLRHWLGHMSPDERMSARVLLQEMHKLSMGKNVLAIAGHNQSAVNHQRLRGLREKADESKLTLAPPIFTDWSNADAYRVARTLFKRVQHHDMIWTAGPAIASAVSDLISENPAYKKENIVTGTFDWSAEAIELVKQGNVQLSYGGHFMETGWVLVLAHDYLNGLDFVSDTGTLVQSQLKRMDSRNVLSIEKMVNEKNWQNIDFRQFSKCHNDTLPRYVFEISHGL